MVCCHYYAPTTAGDTAFTVDISKITFGPGVLGEVGDHAASLGLKRVALMTDRGLAGFEHVTIARRSLEAAGLDVAFYDAVQVEPTDESFADATRFAREVDVDGFVSVGGGSVIDTCKAANLYSRYPADFVTYLNAPVGGDQSVPGPLKPHIACPTTAGTGSECSGVAIVDLKAMGVKTGIVSRRLRPSLALIDPDATATLPRSVVAASGFDVLSHALESYTGMPFSRRARPARPCQRPMAQGANPWSDMGCLEAMRIVGQYLERAVADAGDAEARMWMMWGATLAGIAFGNAGCHAPHGMSYSVAGLVRDVHVDGYPDGVAMLPHGMAVILNAPSVFRYTAPACPGRHLAAADCLGADTRGAGEADAGLVLSDRLIALMRGTDMPNGIAGVGYGRQDIAALTEGADLQRRLIDNAPRPIDKETLAELFTDALSYW